MRGCIAAEAVESVPLSSDEALCGRDKCFRCFCSHAFEIAGQGCSNERRSVGFAEPVAFEERLQGVQLGDCLLVNTNLQLGIEFLCRRTAQAERLTQCLERRNHDQTPPSVVSA